MATGSPSGSVTPATDTSTKRWFGGQSTAGLAVATLQSGGRLPGVVVEVVGAAVLVVVVQALPSVSAQGALTSGVVSHWPVEVLQALLVQASPVQVGQRSTKPDDETPVCKPLSHVVSAGGTIE